MIRPVRAAVDLREQGSRLPRLQIEAEDGALPREVSRRRIEGQGGEPPVSVETRITEHHPVRSELRRVLLAAAGAPRTAHLEQIGEIGFEGDLERDMPTAFVVVPHDEALEAGRLPEEARATHMNEVVLELEPTVVIEIGIGEIAGQGRIVVPHRRGQQHRAPSFDRQVEMRQVPGIAVEDALRAAGSRECVAVVVEDGEAVAMLQGPRPAFLKRGGGGDEELELMGRFASHRRGCVRYGFGADWLHVRSASMRRPAGELPATALPDGRDLVPHSRQAAIDREIILRHALGGEALLEGRPHLTTIQPVETSHRLRRITDGSDDVAGQAVIDHFRNRAAAERDHRRPAGHGFDHDEAERLRPVDRKQERAGIAEKFRLPLLVDLADELDIRVRGDQRRDRPVPIDLIDPVDLGRDPELHRGARGDLDGTVGPLLRRDAAEKGEVIAMGSGPEGQQIARQAVMDIAGPVEMTGQRAALVMGDGDQRHLRKGSVERLQIGQVEPAVQCRDGALGEVADERIMEQLDVEMQDVGFLRPAPDLVEHHDVERQMVLDRRVQSQRHVAAAHELGAGP